MAKTRSVKEREWLVTSKFYEPSTFPCTLYHDVEGGIKSLEVYGVHHTDGPTKLVRTTVPEWRYDEESKTLSFDLDVKHNYVRATLPVG